MKKIDDNPLKLTPQQAEFVKNLIIKNEFIIRAQIKSVLQDNYYQYGDDCFGDLCLIVCQKAETLLNHENPSAWVVVAARNAAINMARKIATKANNTAEKEVSDSPCEEMGYEDVIFKVWLENNSIEKLLSILTPHEREIYNLVYIEKLTSKQVAEKLNISASTVRTTSITIKTKIKNAINTYNF